MDQSGETDPRIYFAAERTFLAWIRTGLGLMGVGFAVSRFGLFLREMSASQTHSVADTHPLSVWSGVVLVFMGVVVNLNAVVSHIRVVRELSAGSWVPGRVSRSAVVLAVVLAVMGVAMAMYLLFLR